MKDYTPFANRLRKMAKHYDKWARRQEIEVYRVYDADLDDFPVTIDRYGAQLYVSVFHKPGEQWTEDDWQDRKLAYLDAIMTTLDVRSDDIFFKLRRRQSGSSQYEKLSIVRREFTVVENGLGFIVNLTDYLDTGLYADHRQTRLMVAKEARGKVVLNLFAYTCSFSVYCAAAGAKRVDSLDLSNTYLDWGKRNLALNDIESGDHRFVKTDIRAWLEEHRIPNYDLIILNPPAFSNSKTMRKTLDLQRDHLDLINHALRLLKTGGKLLFITNARKFKLHKDGIVGAASVRNITKQTLPPDFRKKNLHQSWWIERGTGDAIPPAVTKFYE